MERKRRRPHRNRTKNVSGNSLANGGKSTNQGPKDTVHSNSQVDGRDITDSDVLAQSLIETDVNGDGNPYVNEVGHFKKGNPGRTPDKVKAAQCRKRGGIKGPDDLLREFYRVVEAKGADTFCRKLLENSPVTFGQLLVSLEKMATTTIGKQAISITSNMPIPNTPGCPTVKVKEAEPVKAIGPKISDVVKAEQSDAVVIEADEEGGWEDF